VSLLTGGQISALRADGHKHTFYLSVSAPATLLSAQVNGSLSRGATSIPFDNGTSPGVSRIKAGQTLFIYLQGVKYKTRVTGFSSSGSSPGITGTITVDANPVAWANNAVLEIIEAWEPVTIPPTFDSGTGISTKRQQTYSNQNKQPPPVAKLGPHRVGFLSGGGITFNLNGDGAAMAPGATITGWQWACTGGTIAAATAQDTTIQFTVAGQYWLSLTVTDSNGKNHTGYRLIFVHSQDPADSTHPYLDFLASNVQVSWGEGGQADFEVHGLADKATFMDGALVVLWRKTWFGASPGHITLIENDDGILWAGYILEGSIKQNWNHGTVSFKGGNILEIMKSLPRQAASIHAETAPAYWFQYDYRLTPARILHWLLYWHSSVLEVADVTFPTSTQYKKVFKFNEGSLFSQAQDIAGKLLARLSGNKAGQIIIECDIQMLNDAGRAAVGEYMALTSTDWRDVLTILQKQRGQVGSVKLSGFNFDGQTISAICSIAPAKSIPAATGGGTMSVDGLILANQAEANLFSGRILAQANNEIAEVRLSLAGDYSAIDVTPQYWLTMSLAASENARGLTWTNTRLCPRTVTMAIDAPNGGLLVDLVCDVEAFGPDGVTTICPSVPGAESQAPEWAADETALGGLVAFSSVNIKYDGGADWAQNSTDAAAHGAVDPYWKIKAGGADPRKAILWWVSGGKVYRSQDAGLTAADVTPVFAPANTWADAPAPTIENVTFVQILPDMWINRRWFALGRWQDGSGNYRGAVAVTTNDGAAWTWYDLFTGTPPAQVLPLWLAVTGTHLCATYWSEYGGGSSLELVIFDLSSGEPVFYANESLGNAIQAEVEAGTLRAFPVTAIDTDNLCYVAGRMDAPGSLTGVVHIAVHSVSSGDWTLFESGWGTDVCGALVVGENVNGSGNRTYYAVRQA